MPRLVAPLANAFDRWIELYRTSAACRALVLSFVSLAALIGVDFASGFQPGLRMAYVLPLWLATKRGGRQAGAALVLATALMLAFLDATHLPRNADYMVNFVIQTSVLYSLMRIFHSVESKLRDVTMMATRDALTGLYNRPALEERARKLIDKAALLDQPLVVAMIDCDRFKELNDRFGHAFGDQVLKTLGRSLRKTLPADAIPARNGGDEFIVVFPNRCDGEALAAMEMALDRFMRHVDLVGRCSGFSYGLAVLGEDGHDYEKLLESADQDMYERKAYRSSVLRAS